MDRHLQAVRGALTDLENALNDARDSSTLTDDGLDWLEAFIKQVEKLTREFDRAFTEGMN